MTSNTDLAIMEGRMDAARLSGCASAVDHRGRREIVARVVRCRRARPVPIANDDEKAKSVIDTRRHFRDNPREGGDDGDATAT